MSADTTAVHTVDESARRVLRDDLRRTVGRDVSEIRVTRVNWDTGYRWCALALTVDRQPPFPHREVPLDGGQQNRVAALLREAFPRADWARAQDYDVEAGSLREHRVELPASLGGGQQ